MTTVIERYKNEIIKALNRNSIGKDSKHKYKPCPFCGSTDIYLTFERGYIDDSVVMFCNNCKTSVKLEENDQEGFTNEAAAKAVEAWERRTDHE